MQVLSAESFRQVSHKNLVPETQRIFKVRIWNHFLKYCPEFYIPWSNGIDISVALRFLKSNFPKDP